MFSEGSSHHEIMISLVQSHMDGKMIGEVPSDLLSKICFGNNLYTETTASIYLIHSTVFIVPVFPFADGFKENIIMTPIGISKDDKIIFKTYFIDLTKENIIFSFSLKLSYPDVEDYLFFAVKPFSISVFFMNFLLDMIAYDFLRMGYRVVNGDLIRGDYDSYEHFKQNVLSVDCSAIYIIFTLEKAIYVGQTKNLGARWRNHHRSSEFDFINSITPLFVTAFKVPQELLTEKEHYLINLLKPLLNNKPVNQIKSLSNINYSIRHNQNKNIVSLKSYNTSIICPECNSNDVKSNGSSRGKKRYLCNNCNKSFGV